jgi:hypothetical protein
VTARLIFEDQPDISVVAEASDGVDAIVLSASSRSRVQASRSER